MNSESFPKLVVPEQQEAPSPFRALHFEGFELDLERGELTENGLPIPLRPKTFKLLTHLIGRPGQLLAREALMDAVWPNVIVTDDSLAQCVSELRSALRDSKQRLVKTVPRRGYIFQVDVTPGQPRIPQIEVVSARPPARVSPPRRLIIGVSLVAALFCAAAIFARWSTPNATSSTRNVIAVLPLVDLSTGGASIFAEAVTEDLNVDISRLPDTLVIASSSMRSFAGDNVDLRGLKQQLGASYAVSGSVRRADGIVSIVIKLHSTDRPALLWSDRFDYDGYEKWNWHHDVTARIANSLNVKIDQSIPRGEMSGPGRPLASLEPTLQAWHLLRGSSSRSNSLAARALFEQTLKADPVSSSALSGIALSHMMEVLGRWSENPELQIALAAEFIDRSLSIQPTDPRANFVRGLVLYAQGRIDEAAKATERTLSLYPNQTRALQRLGLLKLQQGLPSEVAEPVLLSLRLNPLDAEQAGLGHFTLGMAEFHLGRDDAAYERMREAVIASPRNGFAWQWMAAIDALNNRLDDARVNLKKFDKLIPGHTVSSLRNSEPSRNDEFWKGRERFYEGLRKAGMPE